MLSRREKLLQQIDIASLYIAKIFPTRKNLPPKDRKERRRRSHTVRLNLDEQNQMTLRTVLADVIIFALDLLALVRHVLVNQVKVRCVVTAALMAYLICYQISITQPLRPGDTLRPGRYRSRCGILSIFPEKYTGCHPATFHLGNDGVLSVRDRSSYTSSFWSIWKSKKLSTSKLAKYCWNKELKVDHDGRMSYCGLDIKMQLSDKIMDRYVNLWPFQVEPPGWRAF